MICLPELNAYNRPGAALSSGRQIMTSYETLKPSVWKTEDLTPSMEIRPGRHLSNYEGWMHADGYAGFENLYRSGKVHEVACMAHIRRKFVDVYKSQGSAIAEVYGDNQGENPASI
jgi:hypothetical protein